MHAFKNIEFAIYCSPQDDTNYKTFRLIEETDNGGVSGLSEGQN